MNEDKVMKEIYEIRDKIYEDIKDMTPEEHTAYYDRGVQEAIKRHGLKIKWVENSPNMYRIVS